MTLNKIQIVNIIKKSGAFLVFPALACLIVIRFLVSFDSEYTNNEECITRVYYADNITKAHEKVIKSFNDNHKERIEIVSINLPFIQFSTNERKEILLRALRSKSNRIDIFTVDIIWVPRFSKWSKPLTDYIDQNEIKIFEKNTLKSCYFKNELVAIPFYLDVGLLYYRRDILETLPDYQNIKEKLKSSITWQEFIDLKKRFSNLDNPYYIFAADNFEGLICCFIETLISHNQPIFTGKNFGLDSPEAKEGLQLLVNLVNKYQLTPHEVTNFDETQCYEYSFKHNAIFFRGWPGLIQQFEYDSIKIKLLDIAALPRLEYNRPAYVFGGWNFMISRNSLKTEAAMEFIRYMLNKENQEIFFEEAGYLPSNKTVDQDLLFIKKHPELNYYRNLLDYGFHRPFLENYTKISDVISYYVRLAIKNEISVNGALKAASEDIKTYSYYQSTE